MYVSMCYKRMNCSQVLYDLTDQNTLKNLLLNTFCFLNFHLKNASYPFKLKINIDAVDPMNIGKIAQNKQNKK